MRPLASFASISAGEQQRRGLAHTPREIAQQPETWKTTFAIFYEQRDRIVDFLERAGVQAPAERRPTVLLVGAGTSDYIGQALAPLLRQMWGCEVFVCASTELLLNLEQALVAGRRYLFISFSRSGDSPEAVAVLERAIANHPAIAHLVVTCNSAATITRICERAAIGLAIVLDDAVNDRSLAMTSSFTNMLIVGQCLAHAWSITRYAAMHASIVAAGERLLLGAAEQAEQVTALSCARICFVGSGALAAIAKESALKVLEMTAGQVKTMAETLLGLRHGPMATLDRETLFVCFAPGSASQASYARDLLTELAAKEIAKARIVVGLASDPSKLAACCEVFVPVEIDIPDEYRAVLDVMFGQLLGLYGSIARGLKPDAPSPEAIIRRVVPAFQLYS